MRTADCALWTGIVPGSITFDEAEGHPFRGNKYVPGISDGDKPKQSIADFCKSKLKEGHAHADVAAMAQAHFGSKTTKESVAWYASKMKAEAKAGESAKPVAPKTAVPKPPNPVKPEAPASKTAPEKSLEEKSAIVAEAYKAYASSLGVKDFIGGKSQSQMSSSEKKEAETKANQILAHPGAYPGKEVAAAHQMSVMNANVKSPYDPVAKHYAKVAQAEKKNAENVNNAVIPHSAEPSIPHLTPPPNPGAAAKDAFQAYSGSTYQEINSPLREGNRPTGSIGEKIEAMDKVLAKSALSQDIKLYRGIKLEEAQAIFGKEITTGSIIFNKAFSSASLSEETAKTFSGGVLLHIDAKAGAHAYDIRHLSIHPSEKEIVLPREAKLKVVSVATPLPGSVDKYLRVRCEYV